jgi:SAM-dependent methyltransferase
MTLDDFHALQTDDGRRLLAELAEEEDSFDEPRVVMRYRKQYPTELVRAGMELVALRRRARVKFSRADAMWFTRDGLEMATSELVSRHTARRFAGLEQVYDLCCGVGGDLLALAEEACHVTAVDRDPVALAMAEANLPSPLPPTPSPCRGGGESGPRDTRSQFILADVMEFMREAPAVDAIFVDPSRREARAAARRPESYAPPLSWCLGLLERAPRVAVKVSPALEFEGIDAEVEVISLDGECKEAVLWLGGFRTCARRATLLRRIDGPAATITFTDAGPSSDALGEIGGWIFEPDPAVIRAGLLRRLAGEFGLRRIDETIAYLTGDAPVDSPLLDGYRVLEVIPWSLKRLNAVLAARKVSSVVIKKRGFPLTPEELSPKLKLTDYPSAHATLLCTRAHSKPVVIIAERRLA